MIRVHAVDSRLNSVSIKFGTQLNSVSSAGFILANFDKKIANFDQTQPTANRRSNFRPLKRHWDSEKKHTNINYQLHAGKVSIVLSTIKTIRISLTITATFYL